MAQLPPNLGNEDQITEMVIRDKAGWPILVITWATLYLTQPDGSVIEKRCNETIQLTDGFQWHAGMLSAKPPIYIGVCELCRYPEFQVFGSEEPTHGLTRMSHLVTCEHRGCGVTCCKHKHAVRCSDRRWRCVSSCAKSFERKTAIKRALHSIFFKRV